MHLRQPSGGDVSVTLSMCRVILSGSEVFNGDGTGTDIVTGRAGGQITLENIVSPTSYSVNADCTGSLTVLGGPTFGLFIAPDGESIATIATDPGAAGATIDWRVSRR